jgi:dipeptidyl aminopeptidase/acylaminoacyl peptidase
VVLGCAPPLVQPPTPTPPPADFTESTLVWKTNVCTVEHVAYTSGGFHVYGWVVTPAGAGPWPLFVFNHGSNVGADLVDHSSDPAWRPGFACYDYLTDNQWMVFLPEGRGYGGSEGPGMGAVLRRELPVMDLLHGRADDVNTGVALLQPHANVRPNCTIIGGISHGGVATLLAAGSSTHFKACWGNPRA